MPPGDEYYQMRRKRLRSGGLETSPVYEPDTRIEERRTPRSGVYMLDDLDEPRPGTSTIRYAKQQTQVHRTTSAQLPATTVSRRQVGTTHDLPRQSRSSSSNLKNPRTTSAQKSSRPLDSARPRRRMHWLLPLGIGMLAMLAIWIAGSLGLAWFHQLSDDFTYGNPRTSQTDYVVGHGNDSTTHPSHFVAINLNRQAVVFEMVAGDPAKSVSYVAPIYIAGDGGDKAPVTLEFRDVTGDKKVDMIIHIHLPSQEQLSVFINDGTKFRPSTNKDKINL